MQRIEGQTFRGLANNDREMVFGDLHLERCVFQSCGFSMSRTGVFRSRVRNVAAHDCRLVAVSAWAGVFEDLLIDGLAIDDLLLVWGAAYRHVTIAGALAGWRCVHESRSRPGERTRPGIVAGYHLAILQCAG